MTFISESGSGHILSMDGATEGGGRNLAPRPMELILSGTGGCSLYDIVAILLKNNQKITDCNVFLKAERALKDPKVFTKVNFHFTVHGKNIKPNMVENAIKLSHEKYCSASKMIGFTAEITHTFEIKEI